MPFNVAKRFIDKFFEKDQTYFNGHLAEDYSKVNLDFFGGECTLAMDVVDQITDYFFKKCYEAKRFDWITGAQIWFETNGTTYFEPKVFKYIEKHRQKIEVSTTIDGCKSCHDACRVYHDGRGSYDDVAAGIKHYIKTYGKIPNSKLTLSPDNVMHLYESILHFMDLGYKSVRCNCCMEGEWDAKSCRTYYDQLIKVYDYIIETRSEFVIAQMRDYDDENKSATCGIDGCMLAVDCCGDIYCCMRYAKIAIPDRPSLRLGTVEHGITQAENKRLLIDRMYAAPDERCKLCPISGGCEMCPGYNYEITGDLTVNPKHNCLCNMIEAKTYKYFQDKCKEKGIKLASAEKRNNWNDYIFELNGFEKIGD